MIQKQKNRTFHLVIGQTPPSLNRWMNFHWAEKDRVKQIFNTEFIYALRRARVPKNNREIFLEAHIFFKDKRIRDASNYGAVLWKFIYDALVCEGTIPDDTAEYVNAETPKICDGDKEKTIIDLEIIEEE